MTLKLNDFLKYIPTKETYVLFGKTLTYSISKEIHDMIMENYGKDAEYFYVELDEGEVVSAITHLKKYFAGANVTIPYKTDVIACMDYVDDVAKRLDSVNTIKIIDGKAYGYNTDILGIRESLKCDDIALKDKNVALLGYGGTANVVADILAEDGAKITVVGRNMQKAEVFCDHVRNNYSAVNISCKLFEEFDDTYDYIFNTTPIGMNTLEHLTPLSDFKNPSYLFDCIYNPSITNFLKIGNLQGIKTRNGLHMLFTQALFAWKIWNNIDTNQSNDMVDKLEALLYKKRLKDKNIVLYGFMGCGKSTIAKRLSKLLEMEYIDTDDLIEKEQNMKISEIFEKYGEKHFRTLENELSIKLKDRKNTIISVGGGFSIDSNNMNNLKSNSVCVFLDTPFRELAKRITNDPSRPLSKEETLKELHSYRHPLYLRQSDIRITKIASPKNTCKLILDSI